MRVSSERVRRTLYFTFTTLEAYSQTRRFGSDSIERLLRELLGFAFGLLEQVALRVARSLIERRERALAAGRGGVLGHHV